MIFRSLARLVLAVLALSLSLPATARDLTFEDRVQAQEAIERVRYAHVSGATLPFEQAVPRALLEKKVATYLAQTVALEDLWNTPLTADMLARELDRQANRSRMPERLLELYAALGNDPFLVAECLARPILVDRLTRRFFASDARFQGTTWDAGWPEASRAFADAGARAIPGTAALALPDPASRAPSTCPPDDTWNNGTLDDAPDARSGHTAVWTGTEMIVWGGSVGGVATGSRYDPATDTWTATSRVDAPMGREGHSAVWTGSRMLIWGGYHDGYLFTGASYDPTADAWAPQMSTVAAPTPRRGHAAVWTGAQMVVWGGSGNVGFVGTGARYDPGTDTWTSVSTVGAPSPRTGMTVVWSGQTMIVWGGNESSLPGGKVASGGRYDPASDTWQATSSLDVPIARGDHAAVWAGDRMFVWGGSTNSGDTNTGSRYDPVTDAWLPISTIGAPTPTWGATAIWTGSKLVVWGGDSPSTGGGRYDPSTDLWQPVAAPGPTVGLSGHSAIWTGSRMIVWGGGPASGGPLGTGGRYDPVADQWTPTAAAPAAAREKHLAIWTGQQMILWGGTDGGSYVNTGDRYDPATDSWSPTSTLDAPFPRFGPTAVWTGNRMIVWGGDTFNMILGNRYDPIADAWTPVSAVGAPHKRTGHSAVWTGSRMIVWGGSTTTTENTGGRYDPATDTWTATSLVGAPSKRSRHAAVWTGSRMVIWGGAGKTGGQYDPGTDTWTATSTVGAPDDRDYFSAVWTGSRMVVWGGGSSAGLQNGARYDPITDTWSPTSLVGAPAGRTNHATICTGKHMVVWGGHGSNSEDLLRSGGRYDPAGDTWTPTSLVSAPVEREYHSAVWTGTAMIVWGGTALTSGGAYSVTPSLDLDGDSFSVCDGDCNDAASFVYPGALETCNGIDDDCDLAVDEGIPPPTVSPSVLAAKSGPATLLAWPAVPGATGYDAVKGNLGPLRNSGGNFTTATKACIADDVAGTTIQDAEVPPPAGGLWFLVRAVSCGGDGTYDEGGPAQQGSRDAEIGASAQACP